MRRSNRNLSPIDARNNQEDINDKNALKASRPASRTRKGRQLAIDLLVENEQDDLEGFVEVCEQTGFQTYQREQCEEVFETECKPTEVAKFRTEIVSKCKTMIDQSCNITMREVPRQECTPTEEKR